MTTAADIRRSLRALRTVRRSAGAAECPPALHDRTLANLCEPLPQARSVTRTLLVTPRRREDRAGLPADAVSFLGCEPVDQLAPGPDLDGSRTVAWSTPVRLSFSDRGPRRPPLRS